MNEDEKFLVAIEKLISASSEWHSVEDCEVEGRHDCKFCLAIGHAKHLKESIESKGNDSILEMVVRSEE